MDLDLPGGVITTHCVSTVVRPGSKQTHDPLQFVKIQSTELSKKAVEQIRLAEEVKITKEKIKEVEEEWQNNLLNWKSKRRKSRSSGVEEDDTQENSHRKIKTFSEILNEKAKSGYRIGYNLHKYVGLGDDEGENDGDDEIGNKNEGTKESSNRVDFLASSYEEQQAQLQKKREELSNKLQELQELENKQRELERQEKGGISERVNATEYSNDEPISQKNTLDSEELGITSNIHPKIDRENIRDWNQASLNQGMRQSPEVAVDDNHNQEQFQISHEEILKTNDKNEETASTQPLGSFSRSDESESENDHPDEHTEVDEEAERKQMLSFKAKLSTFENLSKTKIDDELSKPKTSPSKTRFHKSTSDAQIDITNKSERPIFKSRPPAVEDLARSEGLRVAQQRRQIPENNGVSADIDQTNYRRLERENYQTSVPPLGASYLKSYPSTPGSRGNDSSKIHSSTFPNSEDNRGSWDQHNYVCDKEVEIISERMNRLPGSSNASTMPDISTIQSYETVPKFVPQTCDIGLPPLNSVHLSFSGQSVPNEATFSNVHQQNLGSEEFQQLRPRCRQPISNQHTHLQNTNELYANHNQFVAQKQMPSLPTHSLNASQRDGLNPQFIYSNQFFDPRISQVSVPIKTQEPVLTSPIYQAPHGYESLRQRPYYYPLGDVSSVFPKSFENPHGTRNPDEGLQSSSAPQRINLPDRHSQQIGKNQLASNMSPQRISYNHNHWVIQEAELRRLHSKGSNMGQIKNTINSTNDPKSSSFENHVYENTSIQNSYNCAHQAQDMRGIEKANSTLEGSEQRQNQILSVSGKKKCSNCGDELGRGCAAMVIETLSLYYHINCFRCFVCHTQLGNGSCGTDVRVRNQKLHCHNCYSNDEAGLKFSRV